MIADVADFQNPIFRQSSFDAESPGGDEGSTQISIHSECIARNRVTAHSVATLQLSDWENALASDGRSIPIQCCAWKRDGSGVNRAGTRNQHAVRSGKGCARRNQA